MAKPLPGELLYADGPEGVQEQIANAQRRRGGAAATPGDPDFSWGDNPGYQAPRPEVGARDFLNHVPPTPIAPSAEDMAEATRRTTVAPGTTVTDPKGVSHRMPDALTSLRGLTDMGEAFAAPMWGAAMVPGPHSGIASTLATGMSAPGALRKMISPDEDESRLGGLAEGALLSMPLWGRPVARAIKGGVGRAFNGLKDAFVGEIPAVERLGNLPFSPESFSKLKDAEEMATGVSREVAGRLSDIPGAGQSTGTTIRHLSQLPEQSVDDVLAGLHKAHPVQGTTPIEPADILERSAQARWNNPTMAWEPGGRTAKTAEDILDNSFNMNVQNPRLPWGASVQAEGMANDAYRGAEPVAQSLGAGAKRDFAPLRKTLERPPPSKVPFKTGQWKGNRGGGFDPAEYAPGQSNQMAPGQWEAKGNRFTESQDDPKYTRYVQQLLLRGLKGLEP